MSLTNEFLPENSHLLSELHGLPRLRPLGAIERYMTTRADLGIYNNVAVTVRYRRKQISDLRNDLYNALDVVIQRHPSLSAIPLDTHTTTPCFVRLPVIDLDQAVQFITIDDVNGSEVPEVPSTLDQFIQQQHNHRFEYTSPPSPFWRLFVLEDDDDPLQFTLSFFFHHCIADTKAAIVFHEAIEVALCTPNDRGHTGLVRSPDSPLIPPLENFVNVSSPMDTRAYRENAANEWTGSKQFLPTKTRFCSHWLSADRTRELVNACKQRKLTVTATLQAILVTAMFRVLPKYYTVLKVDCAIALRPWLPCPEPAASMGCFFDTLMTAHHRGPNVWEEARTIKNGIDTIITQTGGDNFCAKVCQIPDQKAWFLQKIGRARASAFDFSNVGNLAVAKDDQDCQIQTVLFSQSAGATSSAIKVSTATGRDGRLTLGLSWQEGVVEDQLVRDLIEQLLEVLGECLKV